MASEADLQAFIDRQRVLLAKERDAEIERSALLLSNCGPKLLEQKGLSIGGLGIVGMNIGLGGKTLVELDRPSVYHTSPIFPPHNLRPGDLARIEAHISANASTKKPSKTTTSTTKGSQAEGVVYKVSDTRIVIAVDSSESSSEELDLPERCRVVKLANSVTYDRMDKAINQLEKTIIPSGDPKAGGELTTLIQVLLAMKPPSTKERIDDLTFFDTSLNDSQKTAVRFCLESPEVACIHGPPGTGKTHTLIEIIRQLTTETPANPKPKRVLVCGASNLSVDNILERLLALPVVDKAQRIKVTRIGHPARVMAHEGILESTLEVKATRTDQAALARDVKDELETTLGLLSGKGKGVKGKGPRGAERRKMWDEVKALRKEYRQREGGVVRSVLKDSQVVLATCHSSGGRQLFNQEFDVVIIDEATQALEAVCWIPIFKAKKLILAGDPMQLPPTILSINNDKKEKKAKTQTSKPKKSTSAKAETKTKPTSATVSGSDTSDETESDDADLAAASAAKLSVENKPRIAKLLPPRTLETTLFDRLEGMYGASIKRMLEVQYRMHDQICSFPSKSLYGSKLKSHESVASHLLSDLPNTQADSEEDKKEFLETPVVFFDTAGCEYFERLDGDGDEGSRCNENEATIVNNWIDKLIEFGIAPNQIAIITPYQAQVTLLTSLLRPKYGPSLEIGTVDGMQGREKEAVIISLVRSNDIREVGFLKEKRRMNVAMTRAKRHLCVVGDSSTVCHGGGYLKKWLAWLEANADVKYAGLE
ncbi:P-loop containing nucleoside triphosphate hydrolase protein [Pholiota conissans]|uniref:DNA helicase n=1 Tax=Pholiota conissans TaxID=109636 RepID=A0A9P5ZGT8_9AGAR|nr:P-loop containing nucleoside triphosphate hydrolase protein [Pholiota conissans]